MFHRLEQRFFRSSCGVVVSRDYNAALNLERLARSTRGTPVETGGSLPRKGRGAGQRSGNPDRRNV